MKFKDFIEFMNKERSLKDVFAPVRHFLNIKRYSLKIILISIMLTLLFSVGVICGLSYCLVGSATGPLRLYYLLAVIKQHYVGEYNVDELFDGAAKGMVKALGDKYSCFLNEETYAKRNFRNVGIGVILRHNVDNRVLLYNIDKSSPAFLSGISDGTELLEVDGRSIEDLGLEEIAARIRGEENTFVNLRLRSDNAPTSRSVYIKRQRSSADGVEQKMLPGGRIGYIKLKLFANNTGTAFQKKYAELEEQGMKGLILDLRDNSGGSLQAAITIAKVMVPKGIIVLLEEKNNTVKYGSRLEAVKYPLAVLVNERSASASEILAGAIKDTHSGKIFGTRTFGKGVVQTVFDVDRKTGVKLTSAIYKTPAGTIVNGKGIEPDVIVTPTSNVTGDNILELARIYLEHEIENKQSNA